MQRFLVDDRRDAQAGFLDQEALDLVGQGGDVAGAQVGRPGKPGDLADAVSHQAAGMIAVQRSDPDDLERPDGSELGDLLLDRHAREQVCDTLLDGQGPVAIGRLYGRHQPFTDPAVSPRTICRSATA